jgi:hypothetical protein
MSKITFITPNKNIRTPGIRKRCTSRDPKTKSPCIKPQQHAGHHAWKASPAHVRAADAPKQKTFVSKIVKLDCLAMVEDPAYRRRLLQDLRTRKLRPAVECMLWYYAKGKPKEMVVHSGTLTLQEELSNLTNDELKQRALDVAKMLSTQTSTIH